jgi:CheY-like chemotaxis protein
MAMDRLLALDPALVPRPLALIVDDDPMVLAVADMALRAMGFVTLMTGVAAEAQALADALIPDLLLTDALMPRMDGRELCLKLKSAVRTENIKIVVMSALYRGTFYRNEAFAEFRVDDYFEKPVEPLALRKIVDRLLPEAARAHPHSNDLRAAS